MDYLPQIPPPPPLPSPALQRKASQGISQIFTQPWVGQKLQRIPKPVQGILTVYLEDFKISGRTFECRVEPDIILPRF